MFAAHSFKGKRVALFGLARSGTACVEALRLGGAEVFAWDDAKATVDAARLTATVKRDPEGTGAMFTTGLFGVFSTFDKLARATSSSSDPNALGGSIARLTKLQTKLGTQRSDIATKQEDLRSRLVLRFAKLDTNVSSSQSTLSFLKQQIDAWNGSNN